MDKWGNGVSIIPSETRTVYASRRVLQTSLWVTKNEFMSHLGVSGTAKNKIQYANTTRLVTNHVAEYIKRYRHTLFEMILS